MSQLRHLEEPSVLVGRAFILDAIILHFHLSRPPIQKQVFLFLGPWSESPMGPIAPYLF